MGLLAELRGQGITLRVRPDGKLGSNAVLTEEQREAIQRNKAAIIEELNAESVVITLDVERTRRAVERLEEQRERLRQRVFDALNRHPEATRAWLADPIGHPEFVVIVMAVRDTGTDTSWELSIPRSKCDWRKLIEIAVGVAAYPYDCLNCGGKGCRVCQPEAHHD